MANDTYPVALGQVIFTKTNVESISTFDASGTGIIDITPNNALTVQKDAESGQYVATMKCILNKEKADQSPYFIDMECIGTFMVNDTIKEESEAKRAVTIISHSVLYGAIRETVAYITSRQAFGTFTLGLSILTPPIKEEASAELPE